MSNYDEPFHNYNREIIITQPNKNKPAHIVNIRESSIETMYHKRHIDALQYTAGSLFRRKWEISQLISKSEVKIKVDNSNSNSLPDIKLDAMHDLNKLYFRIGQKSYDILEYVCGFGHSLKEMNHKFGFPKSYGGHRFRESLDEAAIYYGLKNKGNTIRDR